MTTETYAQRIRYEMAHNGHRMTDCTWFKMHRYLRRVMYGSKPTVAGYERYKAAAKAAFGGAK